MIQLHLVSEVKKQSYAFEQEGISLWKQLQQELAPNYEVVYFSDRLRQVVNHPNELEVLRPR